MLRKRRRRRGCSRGLLVPAAASPAAQHVTLTLDWTPNPDHVGLYYARDEGLFAKAGLDVSIHAPSDPTAPLKLVAVGRPTSASPTSRKSSSPRQEAPPRDRRRRDRPAAAQFSDRDRADRCEAVADLRGRSVGITGVPSDYASLDTALSRPACRAAT